MKFVWDFSELYEFGDRLETLSEFNEAMENATKRLSKALLKWMEAFTPVDEYDLIQGWNGNNFAVTKKENGFEVLIVNKTPSTTFSTESFMLKISNVLLTILIPKPNLPSLPFS